MARVLYLVMVCSFVVLFGAVQARRIQDSAIDNAVHSHNSRSPHGGKIPPHVRPGSHNRPPKPNRCASQPWTRVSCANVTSPPGLLPHPYNCRLFYQCIQPYLPAVCRECPARLHFNPNTLVCDWPQRANCTIVSTTERVSTTEDATSTIVLEESTTVTSVVTEDIESMTTEDPTTGNN